jgi:hypothetical protein
VSLQVEIPHWLRRQEFTPDALVRLIHFIAFYQNPTGRRIEGE